MNSRLLKEKHTQWLKRRTPGTHAVLYATLFVAAVYWGFEGDFLDFRDAFLWLVAFIFIEMNVIQWNEEMAKNA